MSLLWQCLKKVYSVSSETAPIEPHFCPLLPPAIDGNKIALCGIEPTVLGIVLPHAAFRPFTSRLNTSIASIKARQTPSKDHALLFLFLPLLSASPNALLSSKMLRYPMIALFQYGVVWSLRDGQPPTGHLND